MVDSRLSRGSRLPSGPLSRSNGGRSLARRQASKHQMTLHLENGLLPVVGGADEPSTWIHLTASDRRDGRQNAALESTHTAFLRRVMY